MLNVTTPAVALGRAAVIVDVDGTLAQFRPEVEGRWVLGPEKQWDAFFEAMRDAPAIAPVAHLVRLLHAQGNAVLICSGRPVAWQAQTEAWLARQGIAWDAMYLRQPQDDAVPDEIVKAQLHAQMLEAGWAPWLVLDDRDAVVAQWRALGLTCLQCAPGNF